MAKLIGPNFRRGMPLIGTLRMSSGPSRASFGIIQSIAFDSPVVEAIYLGSAGRALRYAGAKTDPEIYLGTKLLFP